MFKKTKTLEVDERDHLRCYFVMWYKEEVSIWYKSIYPRILLLIIMGIYPIELNVCIKSNVQSDMTFEESNTVSLNMILLANVFSKATEKKRTGKEE